MVRSKLAERAAEAGTKLRQSHARTGPRLNRQTMHHALGLKEQKTKSKNKLYAFHAPAL